MASNDPSVDASVPNLNLTAEEKRVYGQLFRQADAENVGVVTGEVAVKFFEKTRLDSRVLGEIWQIADKENRGFLTPAGFGIVLRLIGHAQAGREPSPEIALQQGPLPRFEGFTPNPAPPAPPPSVLQALTTGAAAPIRIPQLTPEKVAQYASLFERQVPPGTSMLPGDQAKQIFEKSGLPNDVLGRIWMLADTEQRGALVQTEFVIAMHLLTSMKSGALRGLPAILPAALYEAATRRTPAGRLPSPTSVNPPISAVPRQLTGQGTIPQMRTGSPLGRPPVVAQVTGEWLITPSDKARFDQLYDELDKTKKGFITGEEAVPFFSQSNLSEDVLAQIWDLADIRSEGRLNKDEFAVAMYLIRQQRSKRDGVNTLPATLPAGLVPPSLRSAVRPTTAGGAFDAAPASAFSPPKPQPPAPRPSALDDLFGLDDPQPPAPTQVALGTGGSATNDPFASGISPPAPSSPARPSPSTSTFKPFVPSSSFGRGLTSQGTGGSNSSAPGLTKPTAPPAASFEDDLLGDAEPEANKSLNSETTELANLSNQIGSLTKQVQDVQGQRTATQNELSQSSIQKKNFEQRLAQLRAMYEKDAQDVRSLETQLTASRNETKKLQTEMAMIDATYQDLQNSHRQTLAALQADQQENAALKEKIRAVNGEIAQLKPQIEKLKSEARQQKGLVAINKKQLATNEGERDKLKAEAEDLTKSNEELARQVSSSSSPVLNQVASPALSTASGNNPFFRRTGSTDITQTFSPPIRSFNDKSFDDVFGPPAAGSSQAGTPPPPAAPGLFKPQNTGTSTGSVGSFATPASTSPDMSRQQPSLAPGSVTSESRQLSSSGLFGEASESTTRQLSPPLSRTSQGEASQDSPSNRVASPVHGGPASENTPKAGAVTSPESSTVFSPVTEESKSVTAADPFGVADQAKAKEDFESAFASFKNAKSGTPSSSADAAKAFSKFDSEFPPISELERDDDSESDSEKGGFDDDFAPASPAPKVPEKKAESRSASPTLTKSSQEASSAPPASFAASEPAPASEKPSSPAPPPSNATKVPGPSMDDIFGSTGATPTATTSSQAAPPSLPIKGAFDDLEDDFEGLEDAKEGSADDDFANISRSGLDDFNAVFDSSPPPSQSKSESANTSTPFGGESSFDFASLSGSAAGSTVAASSNSAPSQSKSAAADAHDWDAIFDSFDDTPRPSSPPQGSASAAAAKEPSRPTVGRALTEEGEHDDPILKKLTSMGYSRKDALATLEKYDYNLERAANYLANQS